MSAKPRKAGNPYTVREPRTGDLYRVKGYGSMREQIAFRPDVDLTKPIAEQVLGKRRERTRRTARVASAA